MSTAPESKSPPGGKPPRENDAATTPSESEELAGGTAQHVESPDEDDEESLPRLKPHLDPKYALGLKHVAISLLFAALFVAFSFLGIRPLELLSHVTYGEWILAHAQLPQADPFLTLAAGMPVDNSAWLSEVIFAATYRLAGAEALSSAVSLLKVSVFVIVGIAVFQRSRSLAIVAGSTILLGLAFGVRMLDAPVDVFGQLALAILLLLITRHDVRAEPAAEDATAAGRPIFLWIAVPVLFALWVNLHVSFVFGVLLLGVWATGRLWDAWRTRDSLAAALAEPAVRRRFWLTELAIVATLANPQLLGAWHQAVRTALDANLRDQLAYSWLTFAAYPGLVLGGAVLFMLVLLRRSKDLGTFEILAFLAFAAGTAMTVYLAPWLAAVVLVLNAGHLARLCRCCLGSPEEPATAPKEELPADAQLAMDDDDEASPLPPGRSFVYSLLCLLVIWLAIMFSPTYDLFAHGGKVQRTPAQLYGANSPWLFAQNLQKTPLQGNIFAPHSWAGYFQLMTRVDGEPLSRQYFANTKVNQLPRRAWVDYMTISGAGRGWEDTLDRYDIRHIVIEKKTQPALVSGIRNSDDWRIRYEDDITLLASRNVPAPPPEPTLAEPPTDAGATPSPMPDPTPDSTDPAGVGAQHD